MVEHRERNSELLEALGSFEFPESGLPALRVC